MPSIYSYSISGDTLNSKVDSNRLRKEIEGSTISIVFHGASTSGDSLYLEFRSDLSTSEQTTLDGIVANHSGETSSAQEVAWVRIAEEAIEENLVTQGHFKAVGLNHSVPSGTGNISSSVFTFPYDIGLLNLVVSIDTEKEKDSFSVHIAPDTIIGTITQDVTTGSTVINATPSALNYARKGGILTLDDGTNSENLGYIIDNDKINNILTVENPTTNTYLASTPTYIKHSIEVIKDIELIGGSTIDIGKTKLGAAYLPKNTGLKIIYKNNQGNAKTFSAILEILY